MYLKKNLFFQLLICEIFTLIADLAAGWLKSINQIISSKSDKSIKISVLFHMSFMLIPGTITVKT